MSRIIHTTQAIILKKIDVGEADKLFSVFTEDFGKLMIKAQGVRHLKSKLRYSLAGFSVTKLSFVDTLTGQERLVDAIENIVFDGLKKDTEKMKSASKIFLLLDRLLQGQEKDDYLWELANQFLSELNKFDFDRKELKDYELRVALEIVSHLGYAEKGKKYTDSASVIKHALEQSML